MIFLVLIILLNCKQHLAEEDYCKVEPTHLLCSTDNKENDYKPVMDDVEESDKDKLLLLVNRIRNRGAVGVLEMLDGTNDYCKSSRMNALKWDSTLEEMATVHVKSGKYGKYKPEQALIAEFQAVGLVAIWNSNNFNTAPNTTNKWIKIVQKETARLKGGFSRVNDYHNARDESVISYNPRSPYSLYRKSYVGNVLLLLRDEYYLIGCSSGAITAGSAQFAETIYFFVCYLGPDEPQESYDLWTMTGEERADCHTNKTTDFEGLCNTDHLPISAIKYHKKKRRSHRLPGTGTGEPTAETTKLTFVFGFFCLLYFVY